MSNIVCFDIGGTFIKYGLMSNEGHLLLKDKVATPKSDIQNMLPKLLCEKVKDFQKNYPISGIGISSCGLVDNEKGEILFSNNLQGYSGMKLSEILSHKLQMPVSVENDVKSACLGEMWKGAIQGKRDVVFLTLGTGIGSTIIIDGKIISGSMKLAGELGHTVIEMDGRPCNCGRKGCYERYAATSALVNDYIKEKEKNGEVVERISGEEIMQLALNQDPTAVIVYKRFIHYISVGLANIMHLLNPEAIIIGGGIADQAEQFIQDINDELKKEIMDIYNKGSIVYSAALGNDAGLYGSGYIALNNLNQSNE